MKLVICKRKMVTVALTTSLVASGMVASVACSGGPGPSSAPLPAPAPAGARTSRAIHVYVKRGDGSSQRVDFGPGTDVSLAGSAPAGGAMPSPSVQLGQRKVMSPILGEGGVVGSAPTVTDPTDIEETAWMLPGECSG